MHGSKNSKPVCAVIGVGAGNGAAFARRFSAEGWAVALAARGSGLIDALAKELPDARAYACDVGDAAAVERTFAAMRKDLGEVDVLIYNAGAGAFGNVEDVTLEAFENAWRVNAFGAFS